MLVGCSLLVVLPIQHWLKIGSSHSALAIAMPVDWASDIDDGDIDNLPHWAPLDASGQPGDIDDGDPDQAVIDYSPSLGTLCKGHIYHW